MMDTVTCMENTIESCFVFLEGHTASATFILLIY